MCSAYSLAPSGETMKEFFFFSRILCVKNLASQAFGIHKNDQFSLVDQVQEMSEPRPTFNNSIESNFIPFYISMSNIILFLYPHFSSLFFFKHIFSLEAPCVLLLDSKLVVLQVCYLEIVMATIGLEGFIHLTYVDYWAICYKLEIQQ